MLLVGFYAMTIVMLYGWFGCYLCDEVREVLLCVRRSMPFWFVEVDIESDDALHARYFECIFVVAIGDEELFQYFVDEDVF